MSVDILATHSQQAQTTLAQHGKSFRFAQWFLAKKTAQDAARLYQFCRVLDDVVDEQSQDNAVNDVAKIRHDLLAQHSDMSWLADYFHLQHEYNLSVKATRDLFETIASDIDTMAVQSVDELLGYCYGVAGTVGRLMRPILGAPLRAEGFAIDMGIAMQLTNIARDVLEDAHKGRCYIPANWLAGIGCDEIINASDEHQLIVKQAIEKLLDMAEQYYSSASQGLIAIPRENRVAIAVAMLVYREIGVVLREQQYDYAKGRVFVSMPRKCLVALQAWWRFAGMEGVLPRHNQALHQAFSKRL